jgi:hypothetical protein
LGFQPGADGQQLVFRLKGYGHGHLLSILGLVSQPVEQLLGAV